MRKYHGTTGRGWLTSTRPRRRRREATTVVSGVKSLAHTAIAASCGPGSSPTCLPNPWVVRLEFSSTPPTYERKQEHIYFSMLLQSKPTQGKLRKCCNTSWHQLYPICIESSGT